MHAKRLRSHEIVDADAEGAIPFSFTNLLNLLGNRSFGAVLNLIQSKSPCSLPSWLDQAFRLRRHLFMPYARHANWPTRSNSPQISDFFSKVYKSLVVSPNRRRAS